MRRAARMPHLRILERGIRMVPASLDDRDRAARRRLAALEAPRKASEQDLLVEHLIDVPAEVLDVYDVGRKKQAVRHLVLPFRQDLVEPAPHLLTHLPLLRAPHSPDTP